MQDITYFIYARKSDESEDRQITSIEDQISETKRIADEMNLNVVDIISEARSAKNPGRPIFNEMIKRIEKGEANGILCWKLNRLARNPIDGGKISMLLQQGIIQHVQTQGSGYLPTDNVLMMLIEFGIANQFVKDLSVDVKRGMLKKAERGWMPSRNPPIGYRHNPERHFDSNIEIIEDVKTFSIIQHLWKLLLTEEYTVAKLKEIADDMGLKTKGGKLLSGSSYYRLFTNPVYYGYFYWRDNNGNQKLYKGKHKPMVSKNEFDRVQMILEKKRLPERTYEKEAMYLSLFQCGECGCAITREVVARAYCFTCKTKFSIKSTDRCKKCDIPISKKKNFSFLNKVYYRCTKKRKTCSQPYINEKNITEQINKHIDNIHVEENFYHWGLLALSHVQLEDPNEKLRVQLQSKLTQINSRMKRYTEMRVDNEISAKEFNNYKTELENQITLIESELFTMEDDKVNWKETFKNALNFAFEVKKAFQKEDHIVKQRVVRQLGSNPTIKGKTLCFSSPKLLMLWQKCQRVYFNEKRKLEPKNNLAKLGSFDESNHPFSVLCTELQKARTNHIISKHNCQDRKSADFKEAA
ncbi:MAG: recombinase family protein [Xanthomarina gelatinilytica]|uniref:recombinase family protein n=1 Tax=Xanthomarina gelatinilytica TaxID=1137281 RepID=UPI003A862AC8